MTEVEITYKEKSIKRPIPDLFREFKKQHLLAYAYSIVESFTDKEINSLGFLYRFLNLPITVFLSLKRFQAEAIFEKLTALIKSPLEIDEWIISHFVLFRWRCIHLGPDGYFDMDVLQLADTSSYLKKYHQSKDEKDLLNLISALYQPVSILRWVCYKIGFIKQLKRVYNRSRVESRAKRYKQLPAHYKQAVLLNFQGNINWLKNEFPHIPFNSEIDNQYGWAGLIFELAGDKLGTVDKVEKANAYNTLLFLDKMQRDQPEKKENKK